MKTPEPQRRYQRERRAALFAQHKCIVCTVQLPEEYTEKKCRYCRAKHAETCREYRNRRALRCLSLPTSS